MTWKWQGVAGAGSGRDAIFPFYMMFRRSCDIHMRLSGIFLWWVSWEWGPEWYYYWYQFQVFYCRLKLIHVCFYLTSQRPKLPPLRQGAWSTARQRNPPDEHNLPNIRFHGRLAGRLDYKPLKWLKCVWFMKHSLKLYTKGHTFCEIYREHLWLQFFVILRICSMLQSTFPHSTCTSTLVFLIQSLWSSPAHARPLLFGWTLATSTEVQQWQTMELWRCSLPLVGTNPRRGKWWPRAKYIQKWLACLVHAFVWWRLLCFVISQHTLIAIVTTLSICNSSMPKIVWDMCIIFGISQSDAIVEGEDSYPRPMNEFIFVWHVETGMPPTYRGIWSQSHFQ